MRKLPPATVEKHVRSALDVIEGIKKEQLEEESKKTAMRETMLSLFAEKSEQDLSNLRFGGAPGGRGGGGPRFERRGVVMNEEAAS